MSFEEVPQENSEENKRWPESEVITTQHPRMIGSDVGIDKIDEGRESESEDDKRFAFLTPERETNSHATQNENGDQTILAKDSKNRF